MSLLALCIGKFDALHLGHRALLEAASRHGRPALLCFVGMAEILGWPQRPPLLSRAERDRVLQDWSRELGQDIASIELPFAEMRTLQPVEFIDYLQQQYPFAALVTGDSFVFGYQRSGNVQTLRELAAARGFISECVKGVRAVGKIISSSRVRESVNNGYVSRAGKLLGRPYASEGVVARGEGRGRQLGFPTANLQQIENLIPASGVYAARADMPDGQQYAAAVNVGHLPSISADRPLSVEVHVLDWHGDCHGQRLRVEWLQRLREEMKFDSLDALTMQIQKDIAQVRALCAD